MLYYRLFPFKTERRVTMANRKDSKGRVLKTGESQRKDGTYMYRYNDIRGNRKSVYASDLKELRKKELDIQRDIYDGIDYTAGNITAIDLIKRYLKTKGNIKDTSKKRYQEIVHCLENYDIFHKKIRDIKQSDVKLWIADMFSNKKKSATVHTYLAVIKLAFQQACGDNVLKNNPFDVKSTDYMKSDKTYKEVLSLEQQRAFLSFVLSDKTGCKRYDDYNILLGTGLRISEYLGLTINDIDLVNRIIHVDHQLALVEKGKYKITSLKSESGRRDLYISDEIYESLVRKIHLSSKRDIGVNIDGYTGFINISNRGDRVARRHPLNTALKKMVKKYNEQFPDHPLPDITPHTLRHTFCTNMAMSGINVKTLQYIMGHSDIKFTLEVYTHVSNGYALNDMKNAMETYNNHLDVV